MLLIASRRSGMFFKMKIICTTSLLALFLIASCGFPPPIEVGNHTFESKIGDSILFTNQGDDIIDVCTTTNCSGIDPYAGCAETEEMFVCRYRFKITVSDEAAERGRIATQNLEDAGGYLSEKLFLILDGEVIDELAIASDLKGKLIREIQISGSGTGGDKETARYNTLENMFRMQKILKN